MTTSNAAGGFGNQQTTMSQAVSPTNGRLAAGGSKEAKLWQQCCAFEEVFLQIMMKEMQQTVPEGNQALANSSGRTVMQSMMNEKVTEVAGRRGTSGLADMLYADFRRHRTAGTDVAAGASRARAATSPNSYPYGTGTGDLGTAGRVTTGLLGSA